MVGFESLYRLDRLSGRYKEVKDQKAKKSSYYDLSPELVFDVFIDTDLNGGSNWIVDSQYGSLAYIDINPDRIYKIYKTEDGLLAKSELRPDLERNDGILTINIEHPCADKKRFFGSVAKLINEIVLIIL